MKTKERILEVALRQFNELGTDQATVRSIAEEAGISHGNLCYHFKNTDALIEALYDRLTEEIDEQAIRMQHTDNELKDVIRQAEITFHLLYKYRFLLLDFVRIIRRIDSIRQKFRTLMQLRRQQFHRAFHNLIAKGLMREEWIPGQYNHLITNLLILGDNWIPNAEIHFDEKGEKVIKYYLEAFIGGLAPYLTETGVREYYRLITES
ncbi:MAG: TetR/AcrR family transcriptional regulator [Phaeodactylibacter sp.]|nr:TetR/AcrR family transcriptional regulator [Phaeodactylibacter sp.]MCB9264834.1 TetR/AcrR family transcriptional regulator [Lewinellaceae bacterium]MCB9286396.1 TetR/AcrR family transcriptional regulator [Lewinellaceae bacterium]